MEPKHRSWEQASKRTNYVAAWITPEENEKLEALVEYTRRGRSAVVRLLIERAYEQIPKPEAGSDVGKALTQL